MKAGVITRGERGYSLIETLVAVAILGTVLMAIITLFYFGRSNVYSGKQMTQAVSVGTRVHEDVINLSRSDVISQFGIAGATLTTVTVAGTDYPNSASVDTAMGTPPALIAAWKTLIVQERFDSGKVTLIFTPVDPEAEAAGSAATLAAAPILRVRTIVEWNESRRRRNVILDMSKVDRTL